jgi:L-2-hydroxyglutarate oxidase LhgO
MERVPCVVIGAGVLGLAVARSLSLAGTYTLVVERNQNFGMETSSRNSEVLHAGLYYPIGGPKANFCRDGKMQLLSYIKERNIMYNQCGKLVVATSTAEIPKLNELLHKGNANGLNNLELLSAQEAIKMEPNLSCTKALWCPFTSIFDSHGVMQNYIVDIEHAKSDLVYNCEVIEIKCLSGQRGFTVITTHGPIECQKLVNCAGLYAQTIAGRIDAYPRNLIPPSYFAKGNYYKLQGLPLKSAPFQRLIYPVPTDGGLGVHATLDLYGNTKFGPDVEWLTYNPIASVAAGDHVNLIPGIHNSREIIGYPGDPYRFPLDAQVPNDFTVTGEGNGEGNGDQVQEERAQSTLLKKKKFVAQVGAYWPNALELSKHGGEVSTNGESQTPTVEFVPDYAGIRPKLSGPALQSATTGSSSHSKLITAKDSHGSFRNDTMQTGGLEFAIHGAETHGVPGLVSMFGIESPGLTASMAIADHVRYLLLR